MQAPSPHRNLTTLQSLRGFAALAVCIAHLQGVEAKLGGSLILGKWAEIGFAGVDLFFVISGFVMAWVTRADQGHIAAIPRFYLHRFARIYPLWWIVLTAVVAVWLVRPDWVYSSQQLQPDLLRSYLLLPDKALPLHAVGWTLIHEVWFYLVFGVCLIAPKKGLAFLLLFWATGVILAALLWPKPGDPFLALIRHPLTLEFLIGATVGLCATKGFFPRPAILLQAGIVLTCISLASILSAPTATFEAEWPRVLLFGVPFGLIIWGWVGDEAKGRRAARWSSRLGDWSYGLYLIHVPVFVAVTRLAAPLSGPGLFDNVIILSLALGIAIFAAFVLHILVERPIAKFVKTLSHRVSAPKV
jgi:exopolysaccharide production protein ExoZ